MASIFATTAEVQRKVHVNADATANLAAFIDDYMSQVESMINVTTLRNWSDDFAGLDVDVKGILKMAATELAAMMVEKYNMDAIGRSTAIASANAHIYFYNLAIKELIKINQAQAFMDGV